ncbi:MAG: GAF domain-containing protein [Candidatus Zixiibacteriota bacterium]
MEESKLEFLSTVSKAITGLLEPKEAFETILDLVARIINYRYATLYGYSEKENELIPVAYRRQIVDLIPSIKFSVGTGISAWVASKKKPILLSKIHTSPHLSHRVVKSFISIPFEDNDELLGVLNLGHSIPGAFTMEELDLGIRMSEELSGLLKRFLLLHDLYNLDTKFRNMKEQIKQKEQTIQEREADNVNYLAKAVSHHVNNPLTSIMGNAQLLLADAGKGFGSILKDRLQKIIDESERIAHVIEELRNLEYIETEDYAPGKKMLKISDYKKSA